MSSDDDAAGGALVETHGSARAITPTMRFALSASAVVFHLGALAQVIAAIWAGWALALVVGAGSLLAQTRGLDEQTFETCLWIAAGIDAVLLLSLGGVWIERALDSEAQPPTHEPRFGERHPVVASIAWLIGATALTSAAAWWPSSFFPPSWNTVVVLATMGFAGATGAGAVAILLSRLLDRLRRWGVASQYRAGLLTGAFLLLGAGGSAALAAGWYEEPGTDVASALGVARMNEGGHYLVEDSLQALCIGAAEVDADSIRGAGAPACSFLGDGGTASGGPSGEGDPDCYTFLWSEAAPTVMQRLKRNFGFSTFDANDVAVHAVEETCTHEAPLVDTIGYFKTVARNRAIAMVTKQRRHVSCDTVLPSQLPTCDPVDPPTLKTDKLRTLWTQAMCMMDEVTQEIVRRHFVDGEKFPAIAAAMRLTRQQVRDRFHNAMKKLRRTGIADCFRDSI